MQLDSGSKSDVAADGIKLTTCVLQACVKNATAGQQPRDGSILGTQLSEQACLARLPRLQECVVASKRIGIRVFLLLVLIAALDWTGPELLPPEIGSGIICLGKHVCQPQQEPCAGICHLVNGSRLWLWMRLRVCAHADNKALLASSAPFSSCSRLKSQSFPPVFQAWEEFQTSDDANPCNLRHESDAQTRSGSARRGRRCERQHREVARPSSWQTGPLATGRSSKPRSVRKRSPQNQRTCCGFG